MQRPGHSRTANGMAAGSCAVPAGRSKKPLVDGEMLGRWVMRHANGTVGEGPLADGKPHGRWVVRHRNGKVTETVFVDGLPK